MQMTKLYINLENNLLLLTENRHLGQPYLGQESGSSTVKGTLPSNQCECKYKPKRKKIKKSSSVDWFSNKAAENTRHQERWNDDVQMFTC